MVVSPTEVFRTVSKILILLCIAQIILSPVSVGKKVSRKNDCIKGNDCITKDEKICCKDIEKNGKIKVRGIEGKEENRMKKIRNDGNMKRKMITSNDKKSKAEKTDNKKNKGVRAEKRTKTKKSKNKTKDNKKKTGRKVANGKKGKQAGKLGNKDNKNKQKNKSNKNGKKRNSNYQSQKGKRKGKQAGKSGNKDNKSEQKRKSIKTSKKRKSNSQSQKGKRKGKKGENKKQKSKIRKGKNKDNSPSKRKKDNNGSKGSKFKCTTTTAECKALGGTCGKKGSCSTKLKSKGKNKNKVNGKRKSNGKGKNKITRMNKKKDKGKSFPCGLFCECCKPKPPTPKPCPNKPTTPECNARAGTCMIRSGCNYKTGNQIITDECDKRGKDCFECCSPNESPCDPKVCTYMDVEGMCSEKAMPPMALEVGAQQCKGACKCYIEDLCKAGLGECKTMCDDSEVNDMAITCNPGKVCCKPKDKCSPAKGKCKQRGGSCIAKGSPCVINGVIGERFQQGCKKKEGCECCAPPSDDCPKKCKCKKGLKGKCLGSPKGKYTVDSRKGCKGKKCKGCKCFTKGPPPCKTKKNRCKNKLGVAGTCDRSSCRTGKYIVPKACKPKDCICCVPFEKDCETDLGYKCKFKCESNEKEFPAATGCIPIATCCMPKECDPPTCKFNNHDGNCSSTPMMGYKDVSAQQCKDKCKCYIKDDECDKIGGECKANCSSDEFGQTPPKCDMGNICCLKIPTPTPTTPEPTTTTTEPTTTTPEPTTTTPEPSTTTPEPTTTTPEPTTTTPEPTTTTPEPTTTTPVPTTTTPEPTTTTPEPTTTNPEPTTTTTDPPSTSTTDAPSTASTDPSSTMASTDPPTTITSTVPPSTTVTTDPPTTIITDSPTTTTADPTTPVSSTT